MIAFLHLAKTIPGNRPTNFARVRGKAPHLAAKPTSATIPRIEQFMQFHVSQLGSAQARED
jgi:hypothetical protein